MIKEELIKVYAYTKAIFGNFTMPTDKLQQDSQNIVWLKALTPYELDVIYTAIDLYAKDNQFVNIAQIAEQCKYVQQIKGGTYKDAYYYLNEISHAVSYSDAKANFEKLSEFSKEIVGSSAKLAQWCIAGEAFNTIVAGRLLKQITSKLKADETKKMLSTNEKVLIESKTKKELKQ